MSHGEIHAWNILDRKPVLAKWEEGLFTVITPTDEPPAEAKWIGPPLVDVQVNGYAGIDFQQDDLPEADLLHAVEQLAQACCDRILFTLVTDDWAAMTRRLANAKQLRDANPALGRAIAGWHIEGPFLSPETGYCGAHPADKMLSPTPERIAELRELTGDDPLLLTMAPEIDGALEGFAAARELGIRVSIGHTNSPAHILRRVTAGGPAGFTHLGNGCPATLDRADNILWRALDTPGLTCGLIPDRWHVSPALFRLIHRLVDPDSIYYTTDAMAAAGAPPGTYRLGHLELDCRLRAHADRGRPPRRRDARRRLAGRVEKIQHRPGAIHGAAGKLHRRRTGNLRADRNRQSQPNRVAQPAGGKLKLLQLKSVDAFYHCLDG